MATATLAPKHEAIHRLDNGTLRHFIGVCHDFLTKKEYKADYVVGSGKRSICAEQLIEGCRHLLEDRPASCPLTPAQQSHYMELWAKGHTEAAKNLRAQIKNNAGQ